ncbi:hypothetical protein SLA2020_212610 [Shorea laevis]
MWMQHSDFSKLVENFWSNNNQSLGRASLDFSSLVSSWNRHVFGNVFKKKKRILARLEGVKASSSHNSHNLLLLHKSLVEEYQTILLEEEDLWRMKSRII